MLNDKEDVETARQMGKKIAWLTKTYKEGSDCLDSSINLVPHFFLFFQIDMHTM